MGWTSSSTGAGNGLSDDDDDAALAWWVLMFCLPPYSPRDARRGVFCGASTGPRAADRKQKNHLRGPYGPETSVRRVLRGATRSQQPAASSPAPSIQQPVASTDHRAPDSELPAGLVMTTACEWAAKSRRAPVWPPGVGPGRQSMAPMHACRSSHGSWRAKRVARAKGGRASNGDAACPMTATMGAVSLFGPAGSQCEQGAVMQWPLRAWRGAGNWWHATRSTL